MCVYMFEMSKDIFGGVMDNITLAISSTDLSLEAKYPYAKR